MSAAAAASKPVVGIIGGTGKEGQGVALRFAAAGYTVKVGSRDPHKARGVVAQLNDRGGVRIEGDSNAAVVAASEVNILTVPFAHAASTIDALRDAFLPGSLLVDVTVPVSFAAGAARYHEVSQGSAVELIREHLPAEVGLVAALKTIPAHRLGRLEVPLDCDAFVCGDSEESRNRAMEILGHLLGLRPVDVGDLRAARALERMTVLLININRRYKIHEGRFRVVGLVAADIAAASSVPGSGIGGSQR